MAETRVRPTREESIGGRCKHFTGIQNKTCKVGVCYDDVRRDPPGVGLPCLMRQGGGEIACEKRELHTPEEIAAIIERQDKGFRDMLTARTAIVEAVGPYKKGKSPDERGSISCPICTTGTLGYIRAAMNGHIHARCSTDGCIAWME